MVSNQVLGARAAAGLLSLCLALAGCAHHRAQESAPTEAKVASSEGAAASASPAPEQMTASEAATASSEPGSNASAGGDTGGTATPVANPTAPMH
jgi:hypothetical protein